MGLITGQEGRRLEVVMARLGYTDEKTLLRRSGRGVEGELRQVQIIVQQAIRAVDTHGLPDSQLWTLRRAPNTGR